MNLVSFLLSWLVSAVVLMAVAYIVPGFTVTTFGAALIAALVVGIVNAIVVPILNVIALPLNFITLGLFSFVISAVGLLLAAALVSGFAINGIVPALIGAVLIALANTAVGIFGGRSFA